MYTYIKKLTKKQYELEQIHITNKKRKAINHKTNIIIKQIKHNNNKTQTLS